MVYKVSLSRFSFSHVKVVAQAGLYHFWTTLSFDLKLDDLVIQSKFKIIGKQTSGLPRGFLKRLNENDHPDDVRM